ncbi:unnamed protein product [Leuciscus chuanchicus]
MRRDRESVHAIPECVTDPQRPEIGDNETQGMKCMMGHGISRVSLPHKHTHTHSLSSDLSLEMSSTLQALMACLSVYPSLSLAAASFVSFLLPRAPPSGGFRECICGVSIKAHTHGQRTNERVRPPVVFTPPHLDNNGKRHIKIKGGQDDADIMSGAGTVSACRPSSPHGSSALPSPYGAWPYQAVRGGFVIQSVGAFVSESVASEIAEALLGFGAVCPHQCSAAL